MKKTKKQRKAIVWQNQFCSLINASYSDRNVKALDEKMLRMWGGIENKYICYSRNGFIA